MPRIIPNEETWVGFATALTAPTLVPKLSEVTGAIDLTPFVISINASTRGNIVQTPSFDSKFETSIAGTITSTFEIDLYRDDTTDTAWDTLPRETKGYFLISRFGGAGTNAAPTTGDTVEVWPVFIVSRSATNLTSNTAQTFQVQCSVFEVPNEAAVVTAT